MTTRIQLNTPYVATIDGQYQLVPIGTVLDYDETKVMISGKTATALSPAEPAGTLATGITHTKIRGRS